MITLSIAAILVVALVAHRSGHERERSAGRLAHTLDSRAIPAYIAIATFAVLWYSWAALDPIPVVHDEMAMVLQAQIFARGLWALPSPPMPEFWEQAHVLVEPAIAAKYFPGHSLAMTPGALVGWPALMPLVLQSTAGALLYVLARRAGGGAVAFCAWIIWVFSPMVMHFGASYFAQATSGTCWLAGWLALLRWRETRRLRWLMVTAFLAGWVTITRPLTGVAYLIPMAVVVLRDVIAEKRWRDLTLALAMGTAVIAIIPLWSARTTGDWRLTPLALYTRMYMPHDAPGFGFDSTPPSRSVTPELEQLNRTYGAVHVNHVPSSLPSTLVSRVRYLSISVWGVSSGVMAVFALLGMFTLRGPTAYALASSVLVVLAHLFYATPPQWTLYYYETTSTLAYLSAAGLAWAASLLARPTGVPGDPTFGWQSGRLTRALTAGALVLALPGLLSLQGMRRRHIDDRRPLDAFHALLATIRDERAIVFVRYTATHNPHVTLVRNVADPATTRTWVVHDRGERRNAELLRTIPGRKAYLFDESDRRTYIYDPATW